MLDALQIGRWGLSQRGLVGRPCKDRNALASAFLAKAIYGFGTTAQLLDSLHTNEQLRCLCGWNRDRALPHESTFSRAFAEFARSELPQRLHAALIEETQRDCRIEHIARDSTAIEARERFPETKPEGQQKQRPPRRCKASERGTRIQRQRQQPFARQLADLPQECNIGVKKSSKGHLSYWSGYKLHMDVADGQIPISLLLTSANLHDSQAAIPLMTMSTQRVTYRYELMDSA